MLLKSYKYFCLTVVEPHHRIKYFILGDCFSPGKIWEEGKEGCDTYLSITTDKKQLEGLRCGLSSRTPT
jgi:hypothetical protein